MKFSATWMMALRALRQNVMRSVLTMLGMIIGVAAVIAMIAIGTGAKAQVARNIAQMGQNVLLIFSGAARKGRVHMGFGSAPTLTKKDYAAIRSEVSGITGATPELRGSAQASFGAQNVSTTVYGVSEDFLSVRVWTLADGANFTDTDVARAAKVALLGNTVATNLFGSAEGVVGQTVRIKNAPYEVVGVLKPKGANMMGDDQDDMILVPWTSAMVRITGGSTFRSITVQLESAERSGEVVEQLSALLRQRHRIVEGKEDDFSFLDQQEIREVATSTADTMTVLLGAIAGVSLLVGGIGIMNIMLVSVTERTKEIGLRMAVGAKGSDILLQFLVESVVLSAGGGLIGMLLGVALAWFVRVQLGWDTVVEPGAVALAFLFSGTIGVFFGFYPARKAAALDPIEALRYE